MKLPKHIMVRVVAGSRAVPVPGAVLMIRLGMPYKNSYAIGPRFTDNDGRATFDQNAIIGEIHLCQKVSPSDYIGEFEDCSSLEVAVLGRVDIERLIAARKLWGQGVPEWRLNERELSILKEAQNNHVFADTLRVVVEELSQSDEIALCISTAPPESSVTTPT